MNLDKLTLEEQQEIIASCQTDPETFFKNILGIKTVWSKQKEIAESVRDNSRTTVKSCHASGKTFISSCIVHWFLQCFEDSIVITTAPTWRQVEKVLWGEIKNMFNKSLVPLAGEALNTQIRIDEKWYAMGLSTSGGDQLQGWHSENVLVIVDEATGVDPAMFEAIVGLMTNSRCRLLLIGNPTNPDGEFYRSFTDPGYNKITISAFDTPNVQAGKEIIPGLCSLGWVNDVRESYGEDSPVWYSRVLGEFPEEGDDVLVPLNWVEKAEANTIELQGYEPKVLAIDVARFGTNDTVFLRRIGHKVVLKDGRIENHQGKDISVTIGRAVQIIEDFKPDIVMIDDDGVGGAVKDLLWRKYNNIYGFVNNSTPQDPEHFTNSKAESYWRVREGFREGIYDLPKGTKIAAQLPTLRYEPMESGKIRIVPKSKTSKGKDFDSPDYADAFMLSEAGIAELGDFEPKEKSRCVYNDIVSGLSGPNDEPSSRTGY